MDGRNFSKDRDTPRNRDTPRWHRRGREDGVKGPRGDGETAGTGGRPRRSVRDAEQVERRRRRRKRHFFTRVPRTDVRARSVRDPGEDHDLRQTRSHVKIPQVPGDGERAESAAGAEAGGGEEPPQQHQAPSPAEAPAVEEELEPLTNGCRFHLTGDAGKK